MTRWVEAVARNRFDVLSCDTFISRLGWWRQAKVVPDMIQAIIVAPDG